MSKPMVSVEGIGKAYRIGLKDKANRTFKEAATAALTAPITRLRKFNENYDDESAEDVFWALKDVAFEVGEGETVGLIGRNGAGKSTLLKILSRITEPTAGRAVMRGRVSSLLEVGTGFHPELTGRENVYLNGAILGMSRAEIAKKFDDIVDFSEVGKFLDTPVKRYSSGMYVRLAFAVAAHLDPQIMIVDEVLAVGDAEFQKKCLGKMNDVVKQGRTILFVSHSMDAIAGLCSSVVVVEGGRAAGKVPTEEGIRRYMTAGGAGEDLPLSQKPRDQNRARPPIFHDLKMFVDGEETNILPAGRGVRFEVEMRDFADPGNFTLGIGLRNRRGHRAALFHTLYHAKMLFKGSDFKRLTCDVPALPIGPGSYDVELILADSHEAVVERVDLAGKLEVIYADLLGTGKLPSSTQTSAILPAQWRE